MVARVGAQRILFGGPGLLLGGCLLGRCVTRCGLFSKSWERADALWQHSFRLNETFPVLAALFFSRSLPLSLCLSLSLSLCLFRFSLAQSPAAARWRLFLALRLAPVPFICCCCVRGLPPAAVVRCVSMAAMSLRFLWSRRLISAQHVLSWRSLGCS